ncbi:hypothetical protein [Nonomuraea sp. NPDC050643]|uniref:hypothetical protein n=1 Tax=Nonomuraea sp. NPDC050643 TaxID=3155660 RepID=UPI0033CAE49D
MSDIRPVNIITAALLARTLLDSIENGELPGSPIRHQGEEIFLHTTGQVEGWLRTCLEKAGLIEPVEDDWEPLPESETAREVGIHG